MYFNKAIVLGNLTRNPELKTLPSGMKTVSFSVASNRTWKKDGEKKEQVEFHNIVAFGALAENIAQFRNKGDQILIEGRLQTQSWEDTKTGKKMHRTEIVALNAQFGARAVQTEPDIPAKEIEYDKETLSPADIPF